jgi:predicted DNA-binding antitoxin AbrB/MazE fold protein
MTAPISVQAVYQDGKLQPKTKLDLPENTAVQVLVMPLTETGQPTLFGAFPQLAALGDLVSQVKQLLNDGIQKQIKILSEEV